MGRPYWRSVMPSHSLASMQRLLAAVGGLGVAGIACAPVPGSPPPPFAVKPVAEALTPADPHGTPAPIAAPALYTTVLKFRIPTGTVFDVSVNGWIVREQSVTPCGND